MRIFRTVLLIMTGICTALAVVGQLVFESGAVIQGFPMRKLFLVVFYWQAISIPLLLVATFLGTRQSISSLRIAFWLAALAVIYPIWVAGYSLWPSTWPGWMNDLKLWPQETSVKLAVITLPAILGTFLSTLLFPRRLQAIHSVQE